MARVLVIEDTHADLELLTKALQAAGHTALVAATAAAGLSLARAILPDLIILDIELAAVDGHTVVRRLKDDSSTRYIPIIAVMPSGEAAADIVAKGYDSGISKPLDADLLRSKVQELIQK